MNKSIAEKQIYDLKLNSLNKKILFGVSAVWVHKFIVICINLILIPLLYVYLDKEILGIWFLMIGAQMVTGFFDFGLGQTLQRRIAFVKGRFGENPDIALSEVSKQKIRNLLATSRRIFHIISLSVFILLLVGGFLYFNFLNINQSLKNEIYTAWIIMSFGYAASMWGWYIEASLNGMGNIGWSNMINTILWFFVLAASYISLFLGYGIIALSFIWFFRGILLRMIGWNIITKKHSWIKEKKGIWKALEFKSMLKPALKWWIAVAGTFFLTGSARYFIGYYMGASFVPDYVATFTALSFLQSLFISLVFVITPLISQMFKAGHIDNIKKYIRELTLLALNLLIMIYLFIGFYGEEIFSLWLDKNHFVGYPVLFFLLLMMFLEAHHGMLNVINIAAEELSFYKYTLASGFISILLFIFLIPLLGVLGAAVSIFTAQLITNNWKIPMIALRIINYKFFDYIKDVIMKIAFAGISILSFHIVLKYLNVTKVLSIILTAVLISIFSFIYIKRSIIFLSQK
ncbi:MAG: hypothetical protein OEZ22_02230 [Spirochaetia bacterium]|nr:hypothetical protein [Spirochaetia bacterium]